MSRFYTAYICKQVPNKGLCDDRSQQYGNCTLSLNGLHPESSLVAFSPYSIAANGAADIDHLLLLYYSPMTAKKLGHRPMAGSVNLSHVCIPTADAGGIPPRNTTTAIPFDNVKTENHESRWDYPKCIV